MISDHTSFELSINPAPAPGELTVIFCGEGHPVGGHRIGPAVHDYYLMHTVQSGSGHFAIGGKRYKCKAGDTFLIFPGETFDYEADARDPWHYMWVSFVGAAAGSLLESIGLTVRQPVVRGAGQAVSALCRELRARLREQDIARLADLEAAGYLRLLLTRLGEANRDRIQPDTRAPSDIERQIAHAMRLLATHYTQHVSIEKLSQSCGYHRTHFSAMFKKATGLSPKQYLLKVRMERAETLLATALPIEQVASSVGYADALYFSKQFHKWSGRSPSAYRRALQRREAAKRPANARRQH